MKMIQSNAIKSLAEYLALTKHVLGQEHRENEKVAVGKRKYRYVVPERPDRCHECDGKSCFWVHSYWFRWAVEGELEAVVPIPRYECSCCGAVVSVMFAFLAPYQQFSIRVMSAAIERYLLALTSYREVAGELSGENFRPSYMRVWDWVEAFTEKVQQFLLTKIQRACVDLEKEEKDLIKARSSMCPNAAEAHTRAKFNRLNLAAATVKLTELIVGSSKPVQSLHAYFLEDVHHPVPILTGRNVELLAPQRA